MRPVLVILATAIIIGIAYHAFASPDTRPEALSIHPKPNVSAKQPIVRCIPPSVFILAHRLPDGRRVPIAMIVSPGTC